MNELNAHLVLRRLPAPIVLAAPVVFTIAPAAAHGDTASSQPAWTFDPWIVIPIVVFGLCYGCGTLRLWRRAGRLRPHVLHWRTLAGVAGWFTLAGALVSPLHWLSERLFTFHMIEHEILMAVSAPLIVIARPIGPLMWGLPVRIRRLAGAAMKSSPAQSAWGLITAGTIATCLHAIAIWVWHVPPLFDAAVDNVALYRLQHLSFFVTGVLFWWSVLWRSDPGVGAWHLFVTLIHTSVLGALIALSPHVLYQAQTRASGTWGLTPLEDQQLAGMVMWIPAGTIYAGATLALLALWVSTSSRGGVHADRPMAP